MSASSVCDSSPVADSSTSASLAAAVSSRLTLAPTRARTPSALSIWSDSASRSVVPSDAVSPARRWAATSRMTRRRSPPPVAGPPSTSSPRTPMFSDTPGPIWRTMSPLSPAYASPGDVGVVGRARDLLARRQLALQLRQPLVGSRQVGEHRPDEHAVRDPRRHRAWALEPDPPRAVDERVQHLVDGRHGACRRLVAALEADEVRHLLVQGHPGDALAPRVEVVGQ